MYSTNSFIFQPHVKESCKKHLNQRYERGILLIKIEHQVIFFKILCQGSFKMDFHACNRVAEAQTVSMEHLSWSIIMFILCRSSVNRISQNRRAFMFKMDTDLVSS